MNAFEGVIDDLNITDLDCIEKGSKAIDDFNELISIYFENIHDMVNNYQKNGLEIAVAHIENWKEAKQVCKSLLGRNNERSSTKENIEPSETDSRINSPPRTRTRRNAMKEASPNITKQSDFSSAIKTERSSKLLSSFQNAYVKMEKLSLIGTDTMTPDPCKVSVKEETEEMPAPSRPAPRRKKRKDVKKVQVKQEKDVPTKEICRESDIIIQDVTITTVNLLDSSTEEEKKLKESSEEKKTKRSRTHSSDEEIKDNARKRSKSNEDINENANKTLYEDASSTVHQESVNATFVARPNMNATVVVDKPKYVNKDLIPQSVNDLLTDDESEEEVKKKSLPKPVKAIPKPTKQVFSPFEQSPVKKKVQAFEKLKADATATPPRITRTKTRAQAKEQNEQTANDENRTGIESKGNVKEKAKLFTPMGSKFVAPNASSTTIKSSRTATSSNSNESLLSSKSASALKASQAEFREREKRRREKEEDALKKREALLQAQIEEKKRRREEKQLKAQQQREILEKEKLKVLEIQKLKDERHKQLLAEQEEKKQKQKEELEKKRMLAKTRAIEEKKREEQKRIEEQKKAEVQLMKQKEETTRRLQKQRHISNPAYMKSKAPLLPTEDCYDSDEDLYDKKQTSMPKWTKSENLKLMQRYAFAAGEAIKNTFFSVQVQTPDLQEIFEVIEPKKLKRNSSAVWHKAPRFTMVQALEDHDETEEFDDE